ncbi:4-(cytidine 5'-diphospho)-2-C-methyl-D-erythritol kinase [candidate division WOR-3 bacterium]|nr:4-(cytidine 5'-diphospho)-2-C-methyl-D-erythritol kinase [candidate division WOR-3 bacterium]
MKSIKRRAYAKVNLGLKIIGKRPDGYHNIESIHQTINFFDELEFSQKEEGIELISDSPPYGKENICWKAAHLFLDYVTLKTGVKIKLKKQIWLGAGLGGESSCAAQTLLGLNKLFDTPLNSDSLFKLACTLGSDVPFFLKGGTAIVKGRGEIIEPLPRPKSPIWLILVYPGFSISTAWAYKKIKNYLTKGKWDFKILIDNIKKGDIESLAKNLHNDFEELTFHKYPVLLKIKKKLLDLGALGASLSGSGSCVYGILRKREEAKFRDLPATQLWQVGELYNFNIKVVKAVSNPSVDG